MRKSRLLLVMILAFAAALVFSGCTAVVTDDDGQTYEIPMDEAEEFAREYISEEMGLYISDQIADGSTLAEALGIKQEDIEQIIREEVRGAIAEELKNGDLVDMVFAEAGVSKEDVQAAVGAVNNFTGKAETKKEEPKEEVKAEEKKEEPKEEPKAEEKKEEPKEEAKAEEKKEEPKEEAKAEEKKEEPKEEAKAEEKKEEPKEEAKAEEKKDGERLDDGDPWVDHSLKENISKDEKTSAKDDFYFYANKDWLVKAELKPGKSSESSFTGVSDEINELANAVFKDKSLKSDDAKMVQGFYESVLDWDARNKAGIEPLEPLFVDIQKAQTIEDINDLLIRNDLKTFLNSFVAFGNTPSINDGSQNITTVAYCSLMLGDSAEYEKRTGYGDRYYESNKLIVEKMLERYGYKKELADKIFEHAIEFESKLAKNIYTSEETMMPDFTEKRNNEMSRKELESIFKNYPFFDILEAEGFGKADRFLVFSPDYIKDFDKLYVDENVEDIKAYLLCHLCSMATDVLDREAYELGVEAHNIVSGATGMASDEEYAFNLVRSSLTTPMDKAFLEKYDATKMKKDITEICEEAIDYYRDMLKGEDWLSDETKKMAIKKLDNMTINAVYPEKWEDYSRLSIDGLSYFDAMKEIYDYKFLLNAEKTGKKVDNEIWDIDILEVNAYYDSSNNSINIIRGLLGGAFYREDMSREELLGGVGAAIGHEISHAFDTSGAQYDEKGNFNNWWTDEDYAAFLERADKLVEYYNNITAFSGEKVRGDTIQTEVIADLAGDKCMLGIASKEKNFDYDKFFRANANVWKRINTVEYEYLCLTQDVHPLVYLRVNAAFPQFDEFIETYGIKEGDKMYLAPEDRVLVW